MSDPERTFCYVCNSEYSAEEIDYDLAGNEHCINCGELLQVPPKPEGEDIV